MQKNRLLGYKKLWLLVLELKNVFYRNSESSGYLKGKRQRGCIPAGFHGNDCLAGDACFVGQLLLGHLVVFKAQPANLIT